MLLLTQEGAQAWAGELNKPISVTLDQAGTYIYKCDPHLPLAMVGVIEVGEAQDSAAAKKAAETLKGSIAVNKERLDKYMSQVD